LMFQNKINRRRNSLRLKEFDYTSEGYYFVTVNCKGERPFLENKEAKTIVEKQITDLENRFDILIDCFAIMPDHIHLIIVFDRAKKDSLSKVIQAFKSLVAKQFREKLDIKEKFWQRGFYDHIIRNEKDYLEKKRYILNNPLRKELLDSGGPS
jgi:putative transposase